MDNFFNSIGFEKKLFICLICLALLPLTLACTMFYLDSRKNLLNSANNALTATTRQKAYYLKNYFAKLITDLEIQARNRNNLQLLQKLNNEFKQSGRPLAEFVQDYDWLKTTEPRLQNIHSFLTAYEYQNLLMLDTQGNILFSVISESDLGSNLFTGQGLSDTLFSRTCRLVLARGATLFSDFEFYQPSGGEMSGFMVQEMISAEGEQIGLIALQITFNKIEMMIKDTVGLGHSGETILIGMDGILRSNSRFSTKPTALRKKVNYTIWNALKEMQESGIEEGTWRIPRPELRDEPFLGKIVHLTELEKLGVSWALFSRVAEQEIYAPAHELFKKTLLLFIVTTMLIIVTAEYLPPDW